MLARLTQGREGPVHAVGVSLGGNALLRWAQEGGEQAARQVRSIAAGASRPVTSTPSPRRTTRMTRVTSVSVRPSHSAISNRMEFVPQSIAATRITVPHMEYGG